MDSPKKCLGAYGFDAAAINLFKPISEEAERRGHGFVQIPPLAKSELSRRIEEYRACNAVLINPAPLDSGPERVLGMALARWGRPFWLMEDVPYGAFRKGALALAADARGIIAASDYSAQEARKTRKYKSVEFLGLPQHVKVAYEDMRGTRQRKMEIRGRLRKCINVVMWPFHEKDFLLFIPGPKEFGAGNKLLKFALRVEKVVGSGRFVLAFAAHPGELEEAWRVGKEEQFRKVIIPERERMLASMAMLEWAAAGLKLAHLYALADLVLNNGARSDDIPAAMARIRMMYWHNEATRKFLAESGLFFVRDLGSKGVRRERGKWLVPELGASYKVTTRTFSEGLMRLLGSTRIGGVLYGQLTAQEQYFPIPETWDTASRTVDLLERAAGN